jgi:hypothetical protein
MEYLNRKINSFMFVEFPAKCPIAFPSAFDYCGHKYICHDKAIFKKRKQIWERQYDCNDGNQCKMKIFMSPDPENPGSFLRITSAGDHICKMSIAEAKSSVSVMDARVEMHALVDAMALRDMNLPAYEIADTILSDIAIKYEGNYKQKLLFKLLKCIAFRCCSDYVQSSAVA